MFIVTIWFHEWVPQEGAHDKYTAALAELGAFENQKVVIKSVEEILKTMADSKNNATTYTYEKRRNEVQEKIGKTLNKIIEAFYFFF